MICKDNWDETAQRFEEWWKGARIGRPMMRIVARRKNVEIPKPCAYPTIEQIYLDVPEKVRRYRAWCEPRLFLADAYPNLSVDLGAGSMALYLGASPRFAEDTIWFERCVKDIGDWKNIRYDSENKWFLLHKKMVAEAVAMADGDFPVNMPDIIENMDVLSALRGPEDLIYDMMDEPDLIKAMVEKIDAWYFTFFDAFRPLLEFEGGNCYTAFQIWGKGRTAKIQCDHCSMLSPQQFCDFVLPSLTKQCNNLDHSIYHLDGPGAVKHCDTLMSIGELDALQYTNGAGQPDGANDKWKPLMDKVSAAGKRIWCCIGDGNINDWYDSTAKMIRRYGSDCLYLHYPEMDEDDAREFIRRVQTQLC